jgi:hypothetical protein
VDDEKRQNDGGDGTAGALVLAKLADGTTARMGRKTAKLQRSEFASDLGFLVWSG